ncbi:MAG: hypothetical protein NUV74_04870 [Candidatus Brocadiaceae bacterium]|nr:hypothetical protein [Candidatus Brocadiaceae bacterium]
MISTLPAAMILFHLMHVKFRAVWGDIKKVNTENTGGLMEFKNIGEMVEQVVRHIKKGRGEKEYYTLMHILSRYLYSMRGVKQTVKAHMYIGTGEPGIKKYGCSRFKVDCAVLDEKDKLSRVYEIVRKEKLTPSHQKRFNMKKKMLSDVYGCYLHTETHAEIAESFELWLFHELEDYRCAEDAYPKIIKTIDNVVYQCKPEE